MKLFFFNIITFACISFLAGCSSMHKQAQPAIVTPGHAVNVISPEAGSGRDPSQNPGAATAASMISPVTHY